MESSSSEEGEDPAAAEARNLAVAVNQSVYLMLAVPYALLGLFGFLIYRGMRQNEELRRRRGALAPPAPVEDPPSSQG